MKKMRATPAEPLVRGGKIEKSPKRGAWRRPRVEKEFLKGISRGDRGGKKINNTAGKSPLEIEVAS